MSDGQPSLLQGVPENKDAPCNICGRGWPYHEPACSYSMALTREKRLEEVLREIRGGYEDYYLTGDLSRLLNGESLIRNLVPPLGDA